MDKNSFVKDSSMITLDSLPIEAPHFTCLSPTLFLSSPQFSSIPSYFSTLNF